jgi:hypothetical protein
MKSASSVFLSTFIRTIGVVCVPLLSYLGNVSFNDKKENTTPK